MTRPSPRVLVLSASLLIIISCYPLSYASSFVFSLHLSASLGGGMLSLPLASHRIMQEGQELLCDHQSCGRSFATAAALNLHKCSCHPSRKRLQAALSKGKELWDVNKRACIAARAVAESSLSSASAALPRLHCNDHVLYSPTDARNVLCSQVWSLSSLVSLIADLTVGSQDSGADVQAPQVQEPEAETDDLNLDLPLANRRCRHANRQLPMKFRDHMPQAPPSGIC
jgi:hypothetical protein